MLFVQTICGILRKIKYLINTTTSWKPLDGVGVFLGPNPLGPLDLDRSKLMSNGPNRVFLGPGNP